MTTNMRVKQYNFHEQRSSSHLDYLRGQCCANIRDSFMCTRNPPASDKVIATFSLQINNDPRRGLRFTAENPPLFTAVHGVGHALW